MGDAELRAAIERDIAFLEQQPPDVLGFYEIDGDDYIERIPWQGRILNTLRLALSARLGEPKGESVGEVGASLDEVPAPAAPRRVSIGAPYCPHGVPMGQVEFCEKCRSGDPANDGDALGEELLQGLRKALPAAPTEPAPAATPDHLVDGDGIPSNLFHALDDVLSDYLPRHSGPSRVKVYQEVLAALRAVGALAGPGQVVAAVEDLRALLRLPVTVLVDHTDAFDASVRLCAALRAAAPGEEQADER